MPSRIEDTLGGHADTQARWSALIDGARIYRRDRGELHEAWLAEELTGRSVGRAERPTTIVMAGGPASGKSTLLRMLDLPVPHTQIDPDRFKQRIPEYVDLVAHGEPRAAEIAHEETSDLAGELLRRAMLARHHLVIDQVGDGPPGRFVAKLRALVASGRRVEVVYADVPTNLAWRRASARFRSTGRLVPENTLRSLHREVARRYREVLDAPDLDVVRLYDCATEKPRLIAERRRGSAPVDIVHDVARLTAFLKRDGPDGPACHSSGSLRAGGHRRSSATQADRRCRRCNPATRRRRVRPSDR
jgi:predicted ABC-type ATPase